MLKHLRTIPLVFALSLASAPAFAEGEKPTADSVVATVNGVDITIGHMVLARNGLPEQYRQLPDELLFKALIDQLVNQTVLEQSYEGETPSAVQKTLENQKRTLVAAEAIDVLVAKSVSDEAIKAAYDEKFASASPEKEFNAAHILVETEEEAKALVTELEAGADFAALAKEKSTGPSGPSGGSLGWFGKGMMVAPFEDAVVAMEDGAISAPVQTQFGWHVIKLLETRLTETPSLEELRPTLEQELSTKAVEAEIERLKKLGTIEIKSDAFDPAVLQDPSIFGE